MTQLAHVGGRLKCLPEPNRNVWSGALSRAQWGRVSTVLLKAQWGTALSKAQWGMGTVEGTTLHSTGALSRAANTDSADSFAFHPSFSFPLSSASSSSWYMARISGSNFDFGGNFWPSKTTKRMWPGKGKVLLVLLLKPSAWRIPAWNSTLNW